MLTEFSENLTNMKVDNSSIKSMAESLFLRQPLRPVVRGLKIGMVLGDGFIDIEVEKKAFRESDLKRGVVLSEGFIDIEVGKKGVRESGRR